MIFLVKNQLWKPSESHQQKHCHYSAGNRSYSSFSSSVGLFFVCFMMWLLHFNRFLLIQHNIYATHKNTSHSHLEINASVLSYPGDFYDIPTSLETVKGSSFTVKITCRSWVPFIVVYSIKSWWLLFLFCIFVFVGCGGEEQSKV